MKEFKGTKGEWIYLQELGEVVSKPSGLIADLVVNGDEDHNGKLIAAAPKLLQVLQLIINYHEDGNCELHSEDVAMARAAISKALGEE